MKAGTISYPNYTYHGQTFFIDGTIGGAKVSNNYITTARALKLMFYLESERNSL